MNTMFFEQTANPSRSSQSSLDRIKELEAEVKRLEDMIDLKEHDLERIREVIDRIFIHEPKRLRKEELNVWRKKKK